MNIYQVSLVVKDLATNSGDVRDAGSIPGSGRSSGGRHGNPFQYSCLENPMCDPMCDRRVTESDTTEATSCMHKHQVRLCDTKKWEPQSQPLRCW